MSFLTISLGLFLTAFTPVVDAQGQDDEGGQKPRVIRPNEGKAAPDPAAGLVPGEIPKTASPEARALWQKVLAATSKEGTLPDPVKTFDLGFEVTFRHDNGKNDLGVRYRFLASKGWIRCDIERKDRIQVRGPDGDWLYDDGDVVPLVGRENKQSREEIDGWVAIARNFIALTNPNELRMKVLERINPPDLPFPVALKTEAARLNWLSLLSPDFRLYQTENDGRGSRLYRALLGTDPQSGAVTLAVLYDEDSGPIAQSALLVQVNGWNDLDAYRVPRNLLIHRIVAEQGSRRVSWRFEALPRVDLYLVKGGRLNPVLTAEDFRVPL